MIFFVYFQSVHSFYGAGEQPLGDHGFRNIIVENQGKQIDDVEKIRKPDSFCLLVFKTFKIIEIHKVFIENDSIEILSKSHTLQYN